MDRPVRAGGLRTDGARVAGVPDTVAEAREHPERQAGKGIADAVEHYARLSAPLGPSPSSSGIRSAA
ncbi:MAG TPA: hypothetical protein VIY52_25525 [Streptosporangiaceae bacterium]